MVSDIFWGQQQGDGQLRTEIPRTSDGSLQIQREEGYDD
jgi:hypothetical protein